MVIVTLMHETMLNGMSGPLATSYNDTSLRWIASEAEAVVKAMRSPAPPPPPPLTRAPRVPGTPTFACASQSLVFCLYCVACRVSRPHHQPICPVPPDANDVCTRHPLPLLHPR
jgi:hypothetical protein